MVEQEAPAVPAAEPEEPAHDPVPETGRPPERFIVNKLSASLSGSADDLLLYVSAMLAGRSADLELTITFKNEGEKTIED